MEGTEAEYDPFHFTVGLVDHVLVVRCVPLDQERRRRRRRRRSSGEEGGDGRKDNERREQGRRSGRGGGDEEVERRMYTMIMVSVKGRRVRVMNEGKRNRSRLVSSSPLLSHLSVVVSRRCVSSLVNVRAFQVGLESRGGLIRQLDAP